MRVEWMGAVLLLAAGLARGQDGALPLSTPVVPNVPLGAVPEVQPEKAPRPMRLSAGVTAGQLVTKVNPVYPPKARAKGIEGAVVLHAVIGDDGRIRDLRVVSGQELLVPAALTAVKQWVYRPYVVNGVPTSVETTVTLNFMLGSGSAMADWAANSGLPIKLSSSAVAGDLVEKFSPVYPAAARAAGISGDVVLHAVIGKTGSIARLSVVSGPEELRQAAVDAVQQWRYRPHMLDGEPVRVETNITVNFSAAP